MRRLSCLRNCSHRCKEIIAGPVVSEVDIEPAAGIVTSVVTTRSIVDLKPTHGSEVQTGFKSTEVLLAGG